MKLWIKLFVKQLFIFIILTIVDTLAYYRIEFYRFCKSDEIWEDKVNCYLYVLLNVLFYHSFFYLIPIVIIVSWIEKSRRFNSLACCMSAGFLVTFAFLSIPVLLALIGNNFSFYKYSLPDFVFYLYSFLGATYGFLYYFVRKW